MKKITLLFSLMLMISLNSFAQSEVVNQDVLPQGTVMYSLPRISQQDHMQNMPKNI